jgi:hypothetical protein
MKNLCITRILSASLFLFGGIAMACSPPSPTFDPAGKPVYPPEPTFRYEFVGVVVGEAEGLVPARWNTPATIIAALRIRVVRSLASDLSIGSEHTLYRAGIGADCGFEARSLDTKDFPIGSEVVVKSNDLVSGRVTAEIKDPRSALDKAIRDESIRKAMAEDESVEAKVSGTLLRNGRPAAGLEVASCADYKVAPVQLSRCARVVRVKTNRLGQFQFKQITGVRPPRPGAVDCKTSPGSCLADPGWSYWFLIRDGEHERKFWNGGLGYGRTMAHVECELPPLKIKEAEPRCKVVETALSYQP